jgi:transposase
LGSVFKDAHESGLIEDKPEAAIDSTGLSATLRSAHYARRRRDGDRRYRYSKHPKLTVVCHTGTHLIAAAIAGLGPSYDAPLFAPAMLKASWNLEIDRLLADSGYDAEPNHRMARQGLGIRSTVIALNRRGSRKWPKQPYRRQMIRRFHRRKYGQRWQAESVFSRLKRRLGSSLRGHSDKSRDRETHLKVLTHNLMILAGSSG